MKNYILKNKTISIYAVGVACIIGFYIYSINTGYKWFAPAESGFVPGGQQMNHK